MSDESERAEPGSSSRRIDDDLRAIREVIDRQYHSWDEFRRTALALPNSQARTNIFLSDKMDQVNRTIKAMRKDRMDR